jgi:F420H(2)-dependent quinone reductase
VTYSNRPAMRCATRGLRQIPSLTPPSGRAFAALNSIVRPLVQAGLANPLPIGAGAIVLETTGRRSGLQRFVPLLAGRFGDSITVSTVRSTSYWLGNAEADGDVNVWLGGVRRAATATVARGPLNTVTLTLLPLPG